MKNSKKDIHRLLLFVILFFIGLLTVNHILTDKDAKKTLYGIRYEKSDTIDVIILGNSHANNAFLPMELWNDYGYTGYSMTMMAQTFPLVYYSAKDAIKLQHPELLVVDLFAATSYSNNFDNMHKTIDNLTFSTRIQAIQEFVHEEKRMEYLFPLYLYHDRWADLEIKDFIPYFLRYTPKRNARKGATLVTDWIACEEPTEALEYAYNGEKVELSEDALYWYGRLKELCDENEVELLFVVVPYEAPVGGTVGGTIDQMKMYNAVEGWCSENSVRYLNLFRNLDEMEFDYGTDMQDVSHVNILGAEKVTEAVGRYIAQNYDITCGWDDEDTSALWDNFYELYLAEKNAAIAACGGTGR